LQPLQVVWVGGGSLGLLFAGKCAAASAGRHTLLVRTSEQRQAIRAQGLEVIGADGRFTAVLPCECEVERLAACDWIALMVKQAHLEEEATLRTIRALAARFPQANWACFQNGFGHEERLRRWIPAERLHLAVTTEAARRIDIRTVHHTGSGITQIGRVDGSATSEQNFLASMLRQAGFAAEVSKNIMETVWKKLLTNAAINPLTALLRVKNGALLESPERVAQMRELFLEGLAVAGAEGVSASEEWWDQVTAVCRATADNHSSMLQDIMNGRRTEIEWINGSLLRLGARHGLVLRAHEQVVRRIRELERSRSD
jgi:2-dehydropantoate 2-reductase